jgi:hypothetical protein
MEFGFRLNSKLCELHAATQLTHRQVWKAHASCLTFDSCDSKLLSFRVAQQHGGSTCAVSLSSYSQRCFHRSRPRRPICQSRFPRSTYPSPRLWLTYARPARAGVRGSSSVGLQIWHVPLARLGRPRHQSSRWAKCAARCVNRTVHRPYGRLPQRALNIRLGGPSPILGDARASATRR